jgi:hypothetical protein
MPSDRTTVTELGTALGMLGTADVDEAVRSHSSVMHSVSPEVWVRLAQLRAGGAFDAEFHAAWENGRAFLAAADGLRGRLPNIIEWKGTGRAPGDEVAPIDLRVDHVYLVSCKYLSQILFNVSPSHIFDDLLVGGRGSRSASEKRLAGDWYAETAPEQFQALYNEVRQAVRDWDLMPPEQLASARAHRAPTRRATSRRAAPSLPGLDGEGSTHAGHDAEVHETGATSAAGSPVDVDPPAVLRALPPRVADLTTEQRDALGNWLSPGWVGAGKFLYDDLSARVAFVSAHRWQTAMDERGGNGETMLWRLLRMGSAPYFVLGSSSTRSLRLRIATSWDWRQQFQLGQLSMEPQKGGQPRVSWHAVVRDRTTYEFHEIEGHIEIRWSHGRFGGPPEAKGYLDTPHHLVPGYYQLR